MIFSPVSPVDSSRKGEDAPLLRTVVTRLQWGLQELWQSCGYKNLLRGFANLVASLCKDGGLTFMRLRRLSAQMWLDEIPLSLPNHVSLPPETLKSLAKVLGSSPTTVREMQEGPISLNCADRNVIVAFLDDPESDHGCVMLFSPGTSFHVDSATDFVSANFEFLVKNLQRECGWYVKLEQTQSLLFRDDLTGLFNYRYLEVALKNELARGDRFQSPFCLLFIDLDGFKPVNDQHGHVSGSSVLKQVARVVKSAVREIDIPIRYGGDEFVVVLLGATCAKGLVAAERIRRLIEYQKFRLDDGATTRLTASIGVAAYPEHGRDSKTLLKMADETMYRSKKSGKNRVTICDKPTV